MQVEDVEHDADSFTKPLLNVIVESGWGSGPAETEDEGESKRVQVWKTEKARLKRLIYEKKKEWWLVLTLRKMHLRLEVRNVS